MIPSRETLLALGERTGFDARQLEIVVRLRALLAQIDTDPYLKPRLVLKGGTPFNLCFGPPPRLSVDLDFNYVGASDRDTMLAERPALLNQIERLTRREGYRVQSSSPEHAGQRLYLRYTSALGGDASLVLDLNFLHRIPLDPVETRPFWDPTATNPLAFAVVADSELIAGKLIALLDRVLPRDLYDASRITERFNLETIGARTRALFIAMSGMLDRPLWDYPLSRLDRVADRDIASDLHPLLRPEDRPTAEGLRDAASSLLEPWLELSPAEREYVGRLQQGELRPELVFPEDHATAEKLLAHPALRWKAENARRHAARRGT